MTINPLSAQTPFTTKDGSTIRSILDRTNAPVQNQSLAEATVPVAKSPPETPFSSRLVPGIKSPPHKRSASSAAALRRIRMKIPILPSTQHRAPLPLPPHKLEGETRRETPASPNCRVCVCNLPRASCDCVSPGNLKHIVIRSFRLCRDHFGRGRGGIKLSKPLNQPHDEIRESRAMGEVV